MGRVTETPVIQRNPVLDNDRVAVPLTLANAGVKTIGAEDAVNPKLIRGYPNVNKYAVYGWMRWTQGGNPMDVNANKVFLYALSNFNAA